MFTCYIQYTIDLNKLNEFEEYAKAWIFLIEKYGGTHHGYFVPGKAGDAFPDATFSFVGLGRNGPDNIAVALFSFPDVETYDAYRIAVSEDPLCKTTTERFKETKSFSSYERNFLKPIFRGNAIS
jgi:hypothetical protein